MPEIDSHFMEPYNLRRNAGLSFSNQMEGLKKYFDELIDRTQQAPREREASCCGCCARIWNCLSFFTPYERAYN